MSRSWNLGKLAMESPKASYDNKNHACQHPHSVSVILLSRCSQQPHSSLLSQKLLTASTTSTLPPLVYHKKEIIPLQLLGQPACVAQPMSVRKDANCRILVTEASFWRSTASSSARISASTSASLADSWSASACARAEASSADAAVLRSFCACSLQSSVHQQACACMISCVRSRV